MKTHEIQLFWEWFYCNEITLRTLRAKNPKSIHLLARPTFTQLL